MDRATSIENLNQSSFTHEPASQPNAMHSQSHPQSGMQQHAPHNPSDNELVDDILNELSATTATPQSREVDGGANQEFANHLDTETTHQLQPTTTDDLAEYQNRVAVSSEGAHTQTELSEGERLLRLHTSSSAPQAPAASFDVILFAKTVLLTMILFIVVTNRYTQTLLCRLPYIFSTTLVEGVSSTHLNMMGTVLTAFVSGVVISTVQAFI